MSSGAIVAWVTIAAFGDPTEWLAHEFEHLIEQLDGVEVRDLAARRQGAWPSGDQMFETERAIRVGRQVAEEVRRAVRSATIDAEVAAYAQDVAVQRKRCRLSRLR